MGIKSSYLFLSSLLILILSGGFLIAGHQGFSLRLINFAFITLTLAVTLYILEIRKDET